MILQRGPHGGVLKCPVKQRPQRPKPLQWKLDVTVTQRATAPHLIAKRPANLLLAALAADDYELVRPLLTAQPLRMRETLQEAGEPPEFVYFPTSGIISALTVLENGMMIEFATVGREGTTAVPVFLNMGDSNMALVSQMPGDCLRMTTEDFREQLLTNSSLATIMSRYSGVMLALVAQSAACNRAHEAEARCARWLLMTHDQSATDQFPITHEFLAQMLGVSRPSVSLAATTLHTAGLINYHRGELTIMDRAGLERASCECYAVVHASFLRLQHLNDEDQEPEEPTEPIVTRPAA